jgi:alanyl-tRNA synthetase
VNSYEIRAAFLKFFEEKGHKVIPSSSLIPKDDPTLLLTTAGMVQVKPYFLGQAEPPSRRLASCQKCFRTTDIESVGDDRHLTFFEMLGNFSVGDYFKKEAIAWAWEFFTGVMKISPEKLWVTIYLDDDEAFGYWHEVGVPADKIVRCGEADNFWGPAGNSGPCGPCSEIHYDFGKDKGCGKVDCQPNCACGRFKEIWNLVFTQYNQDEKGKRTPLPRPNIDTGMGLERIAMVMAGKDSVCDTDIFAPLLDRVAALTGKKYGMNESDDNAMRVVAEHGRALAFLIADGVLPDNEGRGYVLRRLLRRGALFGRRLGLDKPFLAEIAKTAIKKMGHVYPELKQRQDFIVKVIEMEESRFEETLNTGLTIIEEILSKKAGKKAGQISSADAFRLYDTYGFPIELTKEIVEKAGYNIDMAGFEKEMEKQRERARASLLRCADCGARLKESDERCPNCGSTKKTRGPINFNITISDRVSISDSVVVIKHKTKATEFTGYTCFEQKSKIVRLLVDGVEAEKIGVGQKAGVILDITPFYAEMGGQVGDTGEISGAKGKFVVTDTVHLTPEIILHRGEVATGALANGDVVQAVVDMARRLDIARNHTATHLLQSALREVLGGHIQQRGSLVAPERLRFDFSHLAAMTPDEIKAVQRIVNERIRQNLPVAAEQSDYKKAVASGAIALFDEKYGDIVRVMRIGAPAVSAELCGGTHISATGEIGYFQIISEGSIGAGLRRIEAVTGRGAEAFLNQRLAGLENIARALETAPETVLDKAAGLIRELERERKRVLGLERELARKEAEALLNRVEVVKGIKVLTAKVIAGDQTVLREMADFLRDRLGSAIVVLGAIIDDRPVFITTVTPDLVKKGHHAGDIIKEVSRAAGGGGGGKPGFAQAGGRDKDKLDEALALVKNLVK